MFGLVRAYRLAASQIRWEDFKATPLSFSEEYIQPSREMTSLQWSENTDLRVYFTLGYLMLTRQFGIESSFVWRIATKCAFENRDTQAIKIDWLLS